MKKAAARAKASAKIRVTASPRRTPRLTRSRTAGSRLTAMNSATRIRTRMALTVYSEYSPMMVVAAPKLNTAP
jgi:hypothetical protein